MKVVDIALKDLLRSLRSAFLLVMMFVAPLLITALLYLAFGGLLGSGGGFVLPRPAVLVVNLDQPPAGVTFNGGELLAQHLSGPEFAQLLDARPAENEAMAREAVDRREADVAVIIPPDFTTATEEPGHATKVLLYYHPDSSIGARVVRVMVSDFVDGFAGAKIAVHVASHQLEDQSLTLGAAGAEAVAQAYVGWVQSSVAAAGGPPAAAQQEGSSGQATVQPILNIRPPAAKTAANQATLSLKRIVLNLLLEKRKK